MRSAGFEGWLTYPTLYVQLTPAVLKAGITVTSFRVTAESFLNVMAEMLKFLKPGTTVTVYLDEPYCKWQYIVPEV